MARFEHKIPAILNPIGDICVEVTIPAHPDYVALFVRAVRQLENNRIYQRDEALGADVAIVQEQWRTRTVSPLIQALAEGTGMCGVDGECLAYPPFASFISYFPQNPYTDPDLVPDGFEQPPFFVNGRDASHDLPNYQDGDVIVDFGSINLEPSWDLAKTPRIELCLTGSGVAEIHFLNIVQGGVAVVSLDNPVDLGDLIAGIAGDGIDTIDLNQDIVSLPPETTEEIIIEVEVPTEGDHIIYIYFLPTVNDSLIPLAFGGALREISLCGNLRPCGTPPPPPPPPLNGVTELKPQFRFTADCGMEYRLLDQNDEIVQDWQGVEGWVENAALCFGGGASMATKEDIRDGIYEAFNRLAAQVVSGRYLNITIDDDGNVSNPETDGSGAGLPEDDPDTPAIDENLAAQAGGCIAVTAGYNSIWADMNAWKTAGLDAATVSFRLQQKYMMIGATETDFFVDRYFIIYSTGHINTYTEVLSGMLFCGSGNFKNTVSDYIIDSIATVLQENAFALNNALSDEQIAAWFNKGAQVPSTAYQTYSCTKIQTEEFPLIMSGANPVQFTTNGVWKAGHRYLIKVTGTYTDTDNPTMTGDGMYRYNSADGSKTFNTLTFNFGGAVPNPIQAQVPYQSSHVYEFTVEKAAGTGNVAGIIGKTDTTMTPPNRTGTLTVTVTDLGEFAL